MKLVMQIQRTCFNDCASAVLILIQYTDCNIQYSIINIRCTWIHDDQAIYQITNSIFDTRRFVGQSNKGTYITKSTYKM